MSEDLAVRRRESEQLITMNHQYVLSGPCPPRVVIMAMVSVHAVIVVHTD